MQEFYIEISSEVTIILTDKEHSDQNAHLLIIPNKDKQGFRIYVENMSDCVSLTNEDDKMPEFNFDKEAFEERMQKLKDR